MKFPLVLFLALGALPLCAQDAPPAAPAPALAVAADSPLWDLAALAVAPKVTPAEPLRAEGVKGIFFDSVPYRGKPTKVFAWLGVPKVEPGKKVPGIVLVHGGGGTAFEVWTRLWVERGYAAIAFDACGSIPLHVGDSKKWQRHDAGGPPGWGGWEQISEAREDQWTQHAVSAGILANSLLRSLPEVDPERIGVTGISWGGYLTSLLAGVDQRFKFAVPVYGCGFTNEHGFAGKVQELGEEGAAKWMRWWDPSSYLAGATMPMLWVNGTNDFAYTMNAWQKSYRLPKSSHTLCLRPRMPHGHEPGWAPKEIAAFADSLVNGGELMPIMTDQGRDGRKAWATFDSGRTIAKAELHFTRDTGPWQKRTWEAAPAQVAEGLVTAELPEGARVYFLNVTDDRELVVSTEHEEIAE